MNMKNVIQYVHRKYSSQPKRRKQIEHLLHHSNHVLHKLTTKRLSLSQGIQALKKCSESSISAACQFLNTTPPKPIKAQHRSNQSTAEFLQCMLQHWFIQYLRLRDGFVLLQSGECRHPKDQTFSQKTRYPSQLTSNKTRADGYTILFSASHYSGFGWDEFYDEERGIKSRLCHLLTNYTGGTSACNSTTIWEKLVDRLPALALFEEQMDHHETGMRELADELEETRLNFLKQMEVSVLSWFQNQGKTKIYMSTKDKFECLELKMVMNHIDEQIFIRIERQGNDFRINDEFGILPDNWTEVEWNKRMKWNYQHNSFDSRKIQQNENTPTLKTPNNIANKKLKRRVIDDDSDDSEIENDERIDVENLSSKTTKIGPGLKIEMKANRNERSQKGEVSIDENHEHQTSLIAIKKHLGVNNETLQTSREHLEAEERETSREVIRDFISEELEKSSFDGRLYGKEEHYQDIMEEINQAKEEFWHHRQNYYDVINGQVYNGPGYDVEVWDARECLRESSMHLGNLYLALYKDIFTNLPISQTASLLDKAESKFRFAIKMIAKQNELYQSNDKLMLSQAALKSNLLLLEGRALCNLAITLIEQVVMKKKESQKSSKLQIGINIKISSPFNKLLQNAITYLERADDCARSMFAQISIASSNSKDDIDLRSAKTDCFQMRYLACRWNAIALWEMGNFHEAIIKLAKIVSEECSFNNEDGAGIRLALPVLLLVEKYLCAMLIVELVLLDVAMKPTEESISTGCIWYRKAALLSDSILQTTNDSKHEFSFDELKQKYDLAESQDLISEAQNIMKSWREKKLQSVSSSQRLIPKSTVTDKWASAFPFVPRHAQNPRGELGYRARPPTGQIYTSDIVRKGRRKEVENKRKQTSGKGVIEKNNHNEDRQNQDANFSSFFEYSRSTQNNSQASENVPVIFRKWGDDFISKKQLGEDELGSCFEYPACVPERLT